MDPVRFEEAGSLIVRFIRNVPGHLAVALAFIMVCAAGRCQSITGTIDGVVKDTSGAIVPNATITVTNEDTGAVHSAVTNEGGAYALPGLPAGKYQATVTAVDLAAQHAELVVTAKQTSDWNAELEFAGDYSAKGYRDVAFWREPGVQVAVSSFEFHSKKFQEQRPCPLNRSRGEAGTPGECNWMTNQFQHLPQWAWIRFGGPRRIDKVVLHAANMASSPVEFSFQYLPHGSATFRTFFHVEKAQFDPETLSYTVRFTPMVTDNIRLVIEKTRAVATPQSWIAQLAQLQVYGTDASTGAEGLSAGTTLQNAGRLNSGLSPTGFLPNIKDLGEKLDISTPWYRIVLDKSYPRILYLAWDSLGKGELGVNLLHESGAAPVLDPLFQSPTPAGTGGLTRSGNVFRYAPVELAPGVYEQVSIRAGARGFDLGLAADANHTVMMRGGLFRFDFAANQTPTTFVCHPSKIMNYVSIPTYLAAPDFGTAYISRTGDDAAFYRTPSSLFPATTYWVDVTPHQPVTEDGLNEVGPKSWHVTLHFAVERIEPLPELVSHDPRLERFPKYSLDMTQWRPDTGILSNSVMSIDCGLAILFYAEEAVFAPHLQDGISPMELVGASVDRYFDGARGYIMPNKNVFAPDWRASRESAAYLVISGWYVIRTIGGMAQRIGG